MTEVILKVPTDIVDAIRLPPDVIHAELQKELALALYKRGILSSGKACSLAGLSRWEWIEFLGQRKVPRHYTAGDLETDIAHARRSKWLFTVDSPCGYDTVIVNPVKLAYGRLLHCRQGSNDPFHGCRGDVHGQEHLVPRFDHPKEQRPDLLDLRRFTGSAQLALFAQMTMWDSLIWPMIFNPFLRSEKIRW
jgi:predicted HTH domain antitoxin